MKKGDFNSGNTGRAKSIPAHFDRKGFPCPLCGSPTGNPFVYQEVTDVIAGSLVGLLRAGDSDERFHAIGDCILALFGVGDSVMLRALEGGGYLEKIADLRRELPRNPNAAYRELTKKEAS
jgi:hypothetical protein